MFIGVGNNDESEKYWDESPLNAVEKFTNNYPDKNILVIEMTYGNESYFYGFLNEKNEELSNEEIEKRFFRELK